MLSHWTELRNRTWNALKDKSLLIGEGSFWLHPFSLLQRESHRNYVWMQAWPKGSPYGPALVVEEVVLIYEMNGSDTLVLDTHGINFFSWQKLIYQINFFFSHYWTFMGHVIWNIWILLKWPNNESKFFLCCPDIIHTLARKVLHVPYTWRRQTFGCTRRRCLPVLKTSIGKLRIIRY